MREWVEIRDFSQGMNQQNAVSASEQPWDLQDVLLTERPELRRRGPFSDRSATSALNSISGTVLNASTYTFLNTNATVAVTSGLSGGAAYVWIWVIEANQAPVSKAFRVSSPATMADICGAWTDPDGTNDRADNRPDAFLVATDKGAYVISYNGQTDSVDDYFQIASSWFDLNDSSEAGDATKRLKGAGFRTCANVGGYSFLGNRFAGGGQNSQNAPNQSYGNAAGRRMWWSKSFNSESWKNKSGEIGSEGGSMVLPFTEAIRFFTELDGNLVIFTKSQIHTMSVPPGSEPTEWVLQQRAGVGTLYPRSVSRYEDSLIFANADGVFQFSGYETISLTEDSIGELYRQQFYQQATLAQDNEAPVQKEVVGIVIGDYYLLSLNENTGYAFCCHLPTNSWVRFSNIPMLAATRTPAEDDRAFGFMKSGGNSRIVRLDRMFVADGSSQSNPPGLDTVEADSGTRGPKLRVELRRYSQGALGIPKLWRSIAVLYDSKALTGLSGNIGISVSPSPDKDDAVWTALNPLGTTGALTEVRQAFASTGAALGVRLEESGSIGRTNIASIELGYKELRRGRAQ